MHVPGPVVGGAGHVEEHAPVRIKPRIWVEGLGFRVSGSGFKVWGLEFRV